MRNLWNTNINHQTYGVQFLYLIMVFFGCWFLISMFTLSVQLFWNGFDIEAIRNFDIEKLDARGIKNI